MWSPLTWDGTRPRRDTAPPAQAMRRVQQVTERDSAHLRVGQADPAETGCRAVAATDSGGDGERDLSRQFSSVQSLSRV